MTTERFSIDSSTKNLFDFELLFITKSKYSDDWTSVIHSHPFTEIFYITNGKGFFVNRRGKLEVRANDIFIINADMEHTEISSDESPLEYISIGINNLSFSRLARSEDSYDHYHFNDSQKYFSDYFNILVDEVRKQHYYYEKICQNYAELLITKILRKYNLQLQLEPGGILSKEVAIAKQFINQHFREQITLDQLASLTNLNRFYFSHRFKEELGRSPIDYLIYRRIEEGKFLLRSTDYTISQIANIIGFTSQSYFSEMFKKYEKKAPTTFRKNYKNNL
ncbi:helix-turn-helix domain-containing protein [Aquibacillus halophilus]|uniref:Helix-turn-helix domain-containing protein n=1 Tax=Aquibacillus halophilus TaxID=930132 RepID=A0A6A8DC50_9BACI|nr:AraC family transcriptional regulator [Aquibacillus halophilus]MRH43295.1 helix-turn-helix domain-containing protein [Aquibacillus halophilus]